MLRSEHLFDMQATVALAVECLGTPSGDRRVIPITDGTFQGKNLRGKVLSGETEVQRIRPDNVAELGIRVLLEVDDGSTIFLRGQAIRYTSPEIAAQIVRNQSSDYHAYCFREALTFETAARHLF